MPRQSFFEILIKHHSWFCDYLLLFSDKKYKRIILNFSPKRLLCCFSCMVGHSRDEVIYKLAKSRQILAAIFQCLVLNPWYTLYKLFLSPKQSFLFWLVTKMSRHLFHFLWKIFVTKKYELIQRNLSMEIFKKDIINNIHFNF